MDDPWGSPWATADSDKGQRPPSPAKSDVAPPPRAFLSASNSPRIPAVVEQSPWAGDDDGFGDWATAAETGSAQAAWGGGWTVPSPNLLSTPRHDVLSNTSPIAWPGNVARSRAASGSSASRQPSPDPWASGNSLSREDDGISTPRLVVDAPSAAETSDDTGEKDALGIEDGLAWDQSGTAEAVGQKNPEEPKKDTHEAGDSSISQEKTTSDAADGREVRVSVDSAPQGPEDRSSSPSYEHTDREDGRPDSPTTSMDEEPKIHAAGSRKVSGKVQELVVKFDGLARAASEERVPVSRAGSRSPLGVRERDGTDDAADFGDFEDADENELPPPSEEHPSEPAAEGPGVVAEDITTLAPPLPDTSSFKFESPIARFGPIHFGLDLTLAEKLFKSSSVPPTRQTDAEHELQDHVINDSFTKISERKTWYRISRLGSSRRHNAADDDSYRRVAWPNSTVHHDAIKIVRRWMEEDSIAGRVALGGGISKTQKNMFGWDSSAEPVALDAVFGKKRLHTRAASLQPLQTATLSSGQLNGTAKKSLTPSHRPSGSAGPSIASFTWSSNSPASTVQPHPSDKLGQPSTPITIVPPSESVIPPSHAPSVPPPMSRPKQPSNIMTTVHVAQAASEDNNGASADDDDEEWGEMVASPVASQPPANGSATQSRSTTSVPNSFESSRTGAVGASSLNGPASNDPWATADLSVFEATPTQPATFAQTPVPMPGFGGSSAKDPASANPAVPSALTNASPAGHSGPSSTHQSLTSSVPPWPTTGDSEASHDEVALGIIANLPDLSYMLG